MNHALSAPADFSGFRSASSSPPQGMGSSSQERRSFTSYPYCEEPSQLFYEDYEPLESDYASTSTSLWHHQGPLSGQSATRHHGLPLSLPSPCYAKHAGHTSAPPPPGSLSAPALGMRHLSPAAADPDDDYIDHDVDVRHHLSPLSLYQSHRLNLYPLPEDLYLSMGLSDGEKHSQGRHHQHHQPQRGMEEDSAPRTGASVLMHSDEDDATTSPEQRPYPTLLDDICRWSTSPESVDTDLDDECSVLSLSLSLSSSMSSSSLSPPFPDSSELRQVDEDDEEDEDVLALSALELSPSPLTARTVTEITRGERKQEQQNRYQHIDQYPLHLYNIIQPSSLPSPPLSSALCVNPDTEEGEAFRHPSPLDLSFSPLLSHSSLADLELEVGPSPQPQYPDENEQHLPLFSSSPPAPLLPLSPTPTQSPLLSSLSPPQPSSLSLPPPPPSSASRELGFLEAPGSGLDSLGLGLLSPSLNSVGLPPPIFSSTPFYDFGDGPVPESPSRRRSTELPLLEEDYSDAGFSPFSSMLSSPVSEYRDLYGFSHQPLERRAHFLSLPGSDTDDDLIPSELASKNYVPDPTITVPTSSSYFSPSEKKSGRSLLMWDADGSMEYPVDGGFGFRGSNYHYPAPYPPRSPSPDLLDLDPKKIEELGGGEEGRRVWEARQRAVKEESLVDMGAGYGFGERDGRDGRDVRERGRERRKELGALLRLKLGLIGGDQKEKESAEVMEEKPEGERAGNDAPTPAVTQSATQVVVASPAPANGASPSDSTANAANPRRSTSPPVPEPNANPGPSASHVATSAQSPTPSPSSTSRPSSSSAPSFKPRITSMAQLVANMVFHRQQHPHSSSTGHVHVHDPSRPKRTPTPPSRSRTWAAGASVGAGGDSSSSSSGLTVGTGVDIAGGLASSPLTKSHSLGISKTPTSPLRQVTLPEELGVDDADGDEEEGKGEAHSNKTPTSTTLSPLFLCASPLSFSAAELEA